MAQADLGFAAHLRPDETLLWHGAPVGDLRLKPARDDLSAGLVGVVTTALIIGFAWYLRAFEVFPIRRALVIVPLVAMAGLSLYPLLVKHHLRAAQIRRTRYGLTNRRALVLAPGRKPRLFALDLRPDSQVTVTGSTLSLSHWPPQVNKESQPEEIHFLHLDGTRTPLDVAQRVIGNLT